MFDCIVIGSGVAGISAAKSLAKQGKKVAVIEKNQYGGVVNNVGSTKKKELVTLADQKIYQQKLKEKGILSLNEPFDWQASMEWINQMEQGSKIVQKEQLNKMGIVMIPKRAKLKSPTEVTLEGQTIQTKTIILATGAKTRSLAIEGEEFLVDHRTFLTQEHLPNRILLVGAGIISFAFASIAAAFGAEVTIIQHDNQALKGFDPLLVHQLIESYRKRNISVYFDQKLKSIEKSETTYLCKTKQGKEISVDSVVNTAGRVPVTDGIGLEEVGVNYDQSGISVNGFLQTSQPTIFACGDCCSTHNPKLASFAVYQGEYLANYLLGKTYQPIRYPLAAVSVFSYPRLAKVGVSAQEAMSQPTIYRVEEVDCHDFLEFKRKIDTVATLKLIVRQSDDCIVGAEMLAVDADETINFILFLISNHLKKEELLNYLFAYPSGASELVRFWK